MLARYLKNLESGDHWDGCKEHPAKNVSEKVVKEHRCNGTIRQ
jgi:hypothetical protein